jgi:protein SCO1/2
LPLVPLLAAALAVLPDMSPSDTTGAMHAATVGAGIEERLGEPVDLTLSLTDENGRLSPLSDYFEKGRPVLLNFAYFHCPMLCGLVQDGMVKALKPLDWAPGTEYEILTVGMDWREGPEEARSARDRILPTLEKSGAGDGWHFLTGDETTVKQLADEVGFRYAYDSSIEEYAHPSGLIFLSPEGKVSRYLFGVNYSAKELNAALQEAGAGKVGSPIQQFILLCFHYSPLTGKYGNLIMATVRASGAITMVALGATVFILARRCRKQSAREDSS